MIEVKIYADTVDQLNAHIANMAGVKPQTDDELLAALRDRMRPKGLVVQVVPFESVEVKTEPVAEKTTRTRKPKPDPAKAGEQDPPPSNYTGKEDPKPMAGDAAQQAAEEARQPRITAPTRADVIAALDRYSSQNPAGQVGARKIMEDTCGTIKLIDVKEAQYPALIEALAA